MDGAALAVAIKNAASVTTYAVMFTAARAAAGNSAMQCNWSLEHWSLEHWSLEHCRTAMKPTRPRPRPATLVLQPDVPPADGEPLVVPIVTATSFARAGIDSAAPHRYSRESNPTVSALEDVLGRLENAQALCFSSGLAAETTLLLATVRTGDHVVCSRAVYGGTTRLLQQVFAPLGITATFVDTGDANNVAAALQPRTKLCLIETPANPTLRLSPLAAIADVVVPRGIVLAVDNTFLTPVLQQPLDLGATITVQATTKFVEGHSSALGGSLATRDAQLRDRLFFLRKCLGTIQSPFQAWATLQGLKTLPLRIERQSHGAAVVAQWLAARRDVTVVHHPSLSSFPQRALADSQHLGHHGAVVSFELAGGLERAQRFVVAVRRCRLAEHVGAVETLLTHPATMTHGSVPAADRRAAGIPDALLRLSVGLEDAADIIADLDQAIAASAPAASTTATTAAAVHAEVAGGVSCPRI